MTTYNFLVRPSDKGQEIVSDAPVETYASMQEFLMRHRSSARFDVRCSRCASMGSPMLALILSAFEQREGERDPLRYLHVIVTDVLAGDGISETSVLHLFESSYGSPLGERIATILMEVARSHGSQDRERDTRHFISEDGLLAFLEREGIDPDHLESLPLSSLLSFHPPKAEHRGSIENPFLPSRNEGMSPEAQSSREPRSSPADSATRSTSPHLQELPFPPPPEHAFRDMLSWRIFKASALFTAGTLIGVLLGPRLLAAVSPELLFKPFGAKPQPVDQLQALYEQLADRAAELETYRGRFEEQQRLLEHLRASDAEPERTDNPDTQAPPPLAPPAASEAASFEVKIQRGVNLRQIPSLEGNEPVRVLQDGEIYPVSREVRMSDGTWYELRYGWIKRSPRTLRLPENQPTRGTSTSP